MQQPPPALPGKPRSRVPDSARHTVLPLVPAAEPRPGKRRPLPDAAAVRLLTVPDSAPPYDDAVAGAGDGGQGVRQASRPGGQQQGDRADRAQDDRESRAQDDRESRAQDDRESRAQDDRESRAEEDRRGRLEEGQQGRPGNEHRGRPGPPGHGQDAAAGWPSRFAQVLAETLAGSRPQGQITPWTTEQARRRIRQLGPMLSVGPAPRVRRIVTSLPAAGVVEMTVIVSIGPAIRALAVRLERDRRRTNLGSAGPEARWVCTAIEAA